MPDDAPGATRRSAVRLCTRPLCVSFCPLHPPSTSLSFLRISPTSLPLLSLSSPPPPSTYPSPNHGHPGPRSPTPAGRILYYLFRSVPVLACPAPPAPSPPTSASYSTLGLTTSTRCEESSASLPPCPPLSPNRFFSYRRWYFLYMLLTSSSFPAPHPSHRGYLGEHCEHVCKNVHTDTYTSAGPEMPKAAPDDTTHLPTYLSTHLPT